MRQTRHRDINHLISLCENMPTLSIHDTFFKGQVSRENERWKKKMKKEKDKKE